MMNGFINLTTRSRLQMLESYPSALPAAQKASTAFQMVDPLVSTPFDSGQTRWDRRFTDVPFATPVTWIFNNQQCALFRTWYRNSINLGADWFEMPIASDDDREVRECHFVQGYTGPQRVGFDRWRVTANLVLRRLPEPDPDWLLEPEFFLDPCRLDIAINWEKPQYIEPVTHRRSVDGGAIRIVDNGAERIV